MSASHASKGGRRWRYYVERREIGAPVAAKISREPRRDKLNEKAKTNEAQPDAGHDLISALEPLFGLACPHSLIKVRLRRSPDDKITTPNMPSTRPNVLSHGAVKSMPPFGKRREILARAGVHNPW